MTRSGKSHSAPDPPEEPMAITADAKALVESTTEETHEITEGVDEASQKTATDSSKTENSADGGQPPQPHVIDPNAHMYPMYHPGMMATPYGPRPFRGPMPRPFYQIHPAMRVPFAPVRAPIPTGEMGAVAKTTGRKRAVSVEEGTLDSDDDKKRRNRAAAQRCRLKKKKQAAELEINYSTLARENTDLRNSNSKLLEELSQLKSLIMEHRRTCAEFNALPLPGQPNSSNSSATALVNAKDNKNNAQLFPTVPHRK